MLTSPAFGNRRCHATVAAQVLDNGPDEHTPGQDARMKHAWGPVPYRWKPNTKNIFVGDLPATLKAHRDANKDRIVRRIRSDRGGFDTRRLVLRKTGIRGAEPRRDGNVEDSATCVALVSSPCQNSGPADSPSPVPSEVSLSTSESTTTSMALEISKNKELPTRTKAEAPYRDAKGSWSLWGKKDSETIQRPWINYVQVEEIDAVLR